MSQLGSATHLVKRFFGAVRPGAPSAADEAWAAEQLIPGEQLLWSQLDNPDRRHAIGVARAVIDELGPDTERPVVAAALLHDVGKIVSGYRTPARVVATLIWTVVPTDRAKEWTDKGAPWQRLGLYRRHPQLGEELLASAGSDPLTSRWAGDHHRPESEWRVDHAIGKVLKDCDDD